MPTGLALGSRLNDSAFVRHNLFRGRWQSRLDSTRIGHCCSDTSPIALFYTLEDILDGVGGADCCRASPAHVRSVVSPPLLLESVWFTSQIARLSGHNSVVETTSEPRPHGQLPCSATRSAEPTSVQWCDVHNGVFHQLNELTSIEEENDAGCCIIQEMPRLCKGRFHRAVGIRHLSVLDGTAEPRSGHGGSPDLAWKRQEGSKGHAHAPRQ